MTDPIINPAMPEEETAIVGVIVDQRTSQPIARGANNLATVIQTAELDLGKIGTLNISKTSQLCLDEKLDPKDVSIRPDGLVYVDWTWYADRLNRAFGKAKWGLIPQGNPMSAQNGFLTEVVWPHWLVIQGIPMGMGVGECSYNPSNRTMSYTDALEGAKSIALSRACKIFGMTLELWNKDWIEAWKAEYAETYPDPKNTNKKLWRKRPVDLIKDGKRKLAHELKDWYPTGASVLEGLTALGLSYSLQDHAVIRRKMVDRFYGVVTQEEGEEQGEKE